MGFNMEDRVPETLINNVIRRKSDDEMKNVPPAQSLRKRSDTRIHGDMEEGILENLPPP